MYSQSKKNFSQKWQNFFKAKLGWKLFYEVPGATKKSPTLKCGKKPRDARLKFDVHAPQAQRANFAPEGRRDFLNTAKLPQWPHLYTSYEATYALKRLLFEKIAKNRFMYSRMAKIVFLQFTRKVRSLGHMLLHNSHINVAITNSLA